VTRGRAWRFLGVAAPALLLVGAAVLTYYNSTANGFVWDTLDYLYQHPFYLSSLGPDHLVWMFTSFDNSNWHPLTWFSWAVDYRIYGGLNPWGYHFTNIVVHGLNSALLFIVLLVVFGLSRPRGGGFPLRTDRPALAAAWLAAALFAVHPQHVESVAWVAERKDLLCQFFMLLTLLTHVRQATCGETSRGRWRLLALLFYCLALLAKPMAVTLPLILLLADVYPLRRSRLVPPPQGGGGQLSGAALVAEKLPYFLLSLAVVLLTLEAQRGSLAAVPLGLRVVNAFHSILFYLYKFFVPLGFSPHYPYWGPGAGVPGWLAILPAAAVLAITVAALVAWRRGRPEWLTGWLFYLIALAPVLGLVQVGEQGAADRYAYFPTLPVYVFAAAALLRVFCHARALLRWLAVPAVLAVIVLLAGKTVVQVQVWKDPLSLWQHAAEYAPNSRLARMNLGITHLNMGAYDMAADDFEAAAKLERQPGKSLPWRGLVYLHLERYGDARSVHTTMLAMAGSRPELQLDTNCLQYNLGWISAKTHAREDAMKYFARVEPGSKPGPAAAAWLEWLRSEPPGTADTRSPEGKLPGFCRRLIPLMAGSQWLDLVKPAER